MFGRANGRLDLRSIDLSKIHDGTDASFSYECIVTGDTFLYANPDHVSSSNDKLANRQFPSGTDVADSPIENDNKLFLAIKKIKKGDKVFARAVANYPDVLEVLTFQQKVNSITGMRETGLGFESGLRGYIRKSKVKRDADVQESFKQISPTKPLFPNDDLMKDVAQYRLADCFFLASIQAILSLPNGDDLIRGMMVRDGNDTIVRLFYPDTHQPVYVRVNNTTYHRAASHKQKLTLFGLPIVTIVDDKTVNHNAPWVHVLEKAYVALALQKSTKQDLVTREHTVSTPSFRQMYGNGGDVATAVRVLTGMDVLDTEIKRKGSWPFTGDILLLCVNSVDHYGDLLKNHSDLLKTFDEQLPKMSKSDLNNVFSYLTSNSEPLSSMDILITINDCCLPTELKMTLVGKIQSGNLDVSSLIDYLNAAYNYINEPLTKLIGGYSSYIRIGRTLDIGKVLNSLSNNQLPGTPIENMQDLVRRIGVIETLMLKNVDNDYKREARQIFALYNYIPAPSDSSAIIPRHDGDAATGVYSPLTLQIFEDIRQNHDQKRVAVVSTHADADKVRVPGMYRWHAYTIIGTHEENLLGMPIKYIRLRNPWGHTGQVGAWDSARAELVSTESVEHPEFDIELSLFMQCVNYYTIGDSANLRAIEAAQKHDEREQLDQVVRDMDEVERTLDDVLAKWGQSVATQSAELQITEPQQAASAQHPLEPEGAAIDETLKLNRAADPDVRPPFENRKSKNIRSVLSYKSEILTATVVSTLACAGVGFALGWFFAPVTFGLSVPAMAGIAAGIGAAVGFVVGLTTSVIASRIAASCANAKQRKLDARDGATDSLLGRQDSTHQRLHDVMPAGNRSVSAVSEVRDDKVLHLGGGITMFDVTEEQKDAKPAAKAADSSRLSPRRNK